MKKILLVILISITFVNGSVSELTDGNYKYRLEMSNKTIVVFYATWCGACRSMKPEYIKASKAFKGNVKFTLVNVDEHKKMTKKYNITSIPTTIVFKKGKEVYRDVGSLSKNEILKIVSHKGKY